MLPQQMPSSSQIFDEFDTQPPLMREEFSQRYIGVEVDWPGTLADAREQKPGQVHVVCWPEPAGKRLIVGDVPLADYPQLRQLRVGGHLRLCGTIRNIDKVSIELDISKLVLTHQLTL